MSPKDFTAARAAQKHRHAITEVERALAELRVRRTALTVELGEASDDSAHTDLASFMAHGEVLTRTRTGETVRAELEQVDGMIAAGELQIASLQRGARDADREAQRQWLQAMTMADAVEYARETLTAIDVAAERGEIEQIERSLARLHEPRLAARDAYVEARSRETNLAMRYRGKPNPATGLTPADAKAETARTQEKVASLRDSAAALRRRHEEAPRAMKERVAAALAHVGRLSGETAERVRAYADQLDRFAGGLANGQISTAALRDVPDLDLPNAADLAELAALAEGAVEAVRRPLPPQRNETEYAPRALT